jgi:hypothetical protein
MMEGSKILSSVCIFLVVAPWVIFGCAGYWFYRKWKRGMTIMEEQHYYPGLQVAELDTAYSDYSGRLIHTEFGLGETARDLDFLQDYASSIYMGWSRLGVSGGTMNCL